MKTTNLLEKYIKQVSAVFILFGSFLIANSLAFAGTPGQSPLVLAALIDDEKIPLREFPNELQKEKAESSWAFYIDNDLFASTGKDRDYTGGISLTLSGVDSATHSFSIDPLLGAINKWVGAGQASNTTLHSFEIGLTAFTPEDTQSAQPLLNDRPYASLAYISSSRQQVNLKKKSSVITSLSIGALGLDIASEFQNTVHNIVDSKQAQGWQNQISDGGELTFRYGVAKQQIRWARYTRPNFNYEIKTASNYSVGYLTEASWSLSGRFGKLRSPWASFNPQNAAYAEKNLPLARANNQPKNEFYLWTGISIHARAYNALIQGQFKDSPVTYGSDDIKHLIAEAWIGVTSELDNGIRMSYFLRGQSSEIKHGPASRNPVWGGIIISRSV